MSRPPHERRALAVVVVVVAIAAVATVATAASASTPTGAPSCGSDDADSTLTSRAGLDASYTDRLTNDSLSDWDGGRVVRVGASGDCSLYVGPTETATLRAALVDGTDGIATGTVDLGPNGTVAFVDGNRTALGVANPGPTYGTELLVTGDGRGERVTVGTGGFVDFLVRFAGNDTRVAVWPADQPWDGDWDVRVEASTAGDHRLRLQGEASLNELAVGTERPEPTPTATPTPTDPDDDDDFPGADFPSEPGDGPVESEPAGPGGGAVLVGLFCLVFGGVGTVYPRPVARLGEQLDAIGSTTPLHEVEPAEWNVLLTRVVSVILALLGGWILFLALG
ncbi:MULTISPECIES: hypothetical protein [Salinibaculum]|uniref:hypothetical protein n=1 Tax=Salinibaculum TaxID=2732368 RepID=UPI0030CE3F20